MGDVAMMTARSEGVADRESTYGYGQTGRIAQAGIKSFYTLARKTQQGWDAAKTML